MSAVPTRAEIRHFFSRERGVGPGGFSRPCARIRLSVGRPEAEVTVLVVFADGTLVRWCYWSHLGSTVLRTGAEITLSWCPPEGHNWSHWLGDMMGCQPMVEEG